MASVTRKRSVVTLERKLECYKMENLLLVKNWRDTAARKRIDSLKESMLTSYLVM